MNTEKSAMRQGVQQLGENFSAQAKASMQEIANKMQEEGMKPKDALQLSDSLVEGIYGQAYRLYNTGRYKEASQLFRLLILLNSTEPKYVLGLAGCFHLLKEYRHALSSYAMCSLIDPENPIPDYHASDCYLKLQDLPSAVVSLESTLKKAKSNPAYQVIKDRAALTLKGVRAQQATGS